MLILLAITAGVLFSVGIYFLLRRNLVKVLVGILLLGYAANLLLFNSAALVPANPPLIAQGETTPPAVYADPVPQALILTAIVISFGITAFAVVLIRQAYQVSGTGDLDNMRCTDIPCEAEEIVNMEGTE